MQYVSLIYLFAFLPAVIILYAVLPQKHRWKLLLLASYGFFISLSKYLIAYLLGVTLTTWFFGKKIEDCKQALDKKRQKRYVTIGVLIPLLILAVLKYIPVMVESLNRGLISSGANSTIPVLHLLVPIGVSFYSLEAVSYLADVYFNKITADRNLGRFSLWLAFFPTVMEGPICRYSETASDLYEGKKITYHNLTFGAQLILWGVFKKIVVADRLNPAVKYMFNNHTEYGGWMTLLAAVMYTVQLYADFSGCIDVTIGAAQIFGVKLPENFRQPFFASGPSDFWHRWHITLGTFFKDYIFYPLSMTKAVKKIGGKARKKFGRHTGPIIQMLLPLAFVWLANGVWHGAGLQYLFYGAYYFVLIVLERFIERPLHKHAAFLYKPEHTALRKTVQGIKMFFIIIVGEMFFRANSLSAGFQMFASFFSPTKGSLISFAVTHSTGMLFKEYLIAAFGFLVMIIVDVLHEKGISLREQAVKMPLPARWIAYYAVIVFVVIFGAYGPGYRAVDAMYAGF